MKRRAALVVTGRLPWPLDDGGRFALWQALWSTCLEFDTTLVTLVPPAELDRPVPPPPRQLEVEIVRIAHRPPPLPVAVVRGALGRWPYTLTRYRNRELDAALRRLVAEKQPALVLVNSLHFATYADAVEGAALVLRQQNLEHRWLERLAASRRNPFVRAYAGLQARRMRVTEAELCTRADLVLSIQEDETAALRSLAPRARVETVPIGLDFGAYLPPSREQPPRVLLLGSFGWLPNVEGARAFLDEGWPVVRERISGVRLRVVGKDLPPRLAEAARRAGAEPVGYVDAMPPEFARSSALIVPLWVGAGARVKIIEALAARLPVVSTPLGAEGLELVPGRHYLEGRTPAELGEALARLLGDPAGAERLAGAGYAHAHARFSLDAVAGRTHALVQRAIERHATLPSRRGRA